MTLSVSVSLKLLFFLILYIVKNNHVTAHIVLEVSWNVNSDDENNSVERPNQVQPLKPPQCGYVIKPYTARVVGGSPAQVGAWPWIANVGQQIDPWGEPDFKCGGSLISRRHVLTAGHCVYGFNNPFVIRLGEHDLSSDDDGADPIDILVEKVTLHPDYNKKSYENDIAIMELAEDVEFTDAIHPICLPVEDKIKNYNFVNHYLFLAGWGSTSTHGPFSDVLLETQVPVVDRKTCANAYRFYKDIVIDGRVICAGYAEGGKDSCKGDSGGPLIFPQNQIYYLIGIVSGGSVRCAEPGIPGLYTRVTSFLDFILSNMN